MNTIQPTHIRDFLANKITLHCPQASEIAAAFVGLPAIGCIEVSCSLAELSSVLASLENVGSFGLSVQTTADLIRGVHIIAFKGKDQPCFDTGRSATYRSIALAVMDDDHHLLLGDTRVCEKTATIYCLPCYKKYVTVSHAKPELQTRLKTNPAQFDCDTFDEDASRLADAVVRSDASEASTAIFYPGPFKLLILADGSMIARGAPTHVSEAVARQLQASDGCIPMQGELAAGAKSPENFAERYRQDGALCLVGGFELEEAFEAGRSADLTILQELPAEMKDRLLAVVESDSDYFIMTGSDARNLDGCCPSDGVRTANRLVEAGILQCARTDTGPDSCPVNIYAFSGEIKSFEPTPKFARNPEFRERVKDYLLVNSTSGASRFLTVLRWVLLLFVVATLGVFAANLSHRNNSDQTVTGNLVHDLSLPFQSGVLVLQFHRPQRCAFCDDMEAHTRDALALYFADEISQERLAYRLVNMEQPQFEQMRRQHGIFTSTLLFVEIAGGAEVRSRIVAAAWDLTDRREAFIEMLRVELNSFRDAGK